MRKIFILTILGFASFTISAQSTRVISGQLTAFNRYPVKNIKVVSKKAKSSVMTDSLGQFHLVCNVKDVIKIESDVFRSVTTRVSKRTDSLTMNLIFIDNPKNRNMATGYGYMSEENLTFALAHLEFENNDFCNFDNVFDLMAGRFAGVTVQSSGGRKGVYIRGINSINLSSEALYVVDGIVMEDINYLFPCDVKSIDVIKDGAAAIYGARGANGVVIIETKGGFN